MQRRSTRPAATGHLRLGIAGIVSALLGLFSACAAPQAPSPQAGVTTDLGTPPTIEVPPFRRVPLRPDPAALEELERRLGGRVRAEYPAFDGDPFYVTLPVREAAEETSEEVLATYVEPILRAIGFEPGPSALRVPESGVDLPRVDFSVLAAAVADDYERREALLQERTREMLAVFTGEAPPSEAIDRALGMGEGMTFEQFVGEIERTVTLYPFQQVEGGIPIEHSAAVARSREGEAVSAVSGVLYTRYAVVNEPALGVEQSVQAAREALDRLPDIEVGERQGALQGPTLVLLPYGSDAAGETQMHHAWRMMLVATYRGFEGPFLLWLDAESGRILKLRPLIGEAGAAGEVYDRDPGVGTMVRNLQVNDAVGSQYVLQLDSVLNRVDYRNDGFDASDVSIADTSGSSTPTFADFDEPPLNDETEALCSSGTNKGFQQVNFFWAIQSYRNRGIGLGTFTPFPVWPWSPVVEARTCEGADPAVDNRNGYLCSADTDCCVDTNCGTCTGLYCNANAAMIYGACSGYYDTACPDVGVLNFAHDNTVVAHEAAHNLTSRFTCARPDDWCPGGTGCSVPVCWGRLHDLADFWADHFESTDCTAGWVVKNSGGTDGSLECATHVEGGGLPRKHEVAVPFDPADPRDHFPEHRALASGGYADGQIGAAALWQVRLGMRSKCRPSGVPQFAVRFARALREVGFLGATPPGTDRGVYDYLRDLERKMLDEWATAGDPGGPPAFRHNGRHTTNKLTAGFARAGVFLVPPVCIDGDAATTDPGFCPGGDTGADAVVDIADNDPADDPELFGVENPENDFLELGGPAPTFHVWTGPRYRFDAQACVGGLISGIACTADADCACPAGAPSWCSDGVCSANERATAADPAPCNSKYRVEVSTDAAFPAADTVDSGWRTVDLDPATGAGGGCYGSWQPDEAQWTSLQVGGALSLIHYRVETRDAADGNVRLSTEPGNGARVVTPPYAVLTTDGESDY